MPAPWIKVQGIRCVAEARLAQAAGADAIGINLLQDDPRAVRLDDAAEIASSVTIETVVVVGDPDPEFLRNVVLTLEPTRLELRGARVTEETVPWYPAIPLMGRETLSVLRDLPCDRVLLHVPRDLLPPEGRRFLRDRTLLTEAGRLGRLVIGGAVDHQNVAAILRACRPWGVEVDAAVEGEAGLKEWTLLQSFVRAARQG